jgi:WD40 repeat protein
METVKNIFKNNGVTLLLGISVFFNATEIVAMQSSIVKASPYMRKKAAEAAAEAGGWYVYGAEGPDNSILVDEDILKLSQTVKNMLEDLAEGGVVVKVALPLNASIAIIKNVFDILGLYRQNLFADVDKKITTLSFEQLMSTIAFLDWLEIPAQLKDMFLNKIRENMDKSNGEDVNNPAFMQLDPDAQKLLMLDPIDDCLENRIIEKYVQNRMISFVGHLTPIISVAFSFDGKRIVSGAAEYAQNNLILWDAETGQMVAHLVGHEYDVHAVAFSPDGKKIVSGSEGWSGQDDLILWDAETGNKLFNLVGHTDTIKSVAFSPDGKKIVSGGAGDQNNLMVWDAETGRMIANLVGHQKTVKSVAFSPDGKRIISGSFGDHNNLILWDAETGNKLFNLVGHTNSVISVALSPDGKKIVSGSAGSRNNLIIWNTETGQMIANLVGHTDVIKSVAFSPDGKRIVSGCEGAQNNLILWDAETGKMIVNLVGHPKTVLSVAFSPDGKRIASGSSGKQNNLILWNAETGQMITNLIGHPDSVTSVAFSYDGKKIVSGDRGDEDNLILWTLLTDQEAATLNSLKNCSLVQIRILYRLCLAQQRGIVVELSGADLALFSDLPKLVFDLLAATIGQESQKRLLQLASSQKQEEPHVQLLPPQLSVTLKEMVAYHQQSQNDPERKSVAESAIEKLKQKNPEHIKLINKTLKELHYMSSKERLLQKQKDDIKRDLNQPAAQANLKEYINALKNIYTPDNEYYEAFNELMKEMGY